MSEQHLREQEAGLAAFSTYELRLLAVALGLSADATRRQIAEHSAERQREHMRAIEELETFRPLRGPRAGGVYPVVDLP